MTTKRHNVTTKRDSMKTKRPKAITKRQSTKKLGRPKKHNMATKQQQKNGYNKINNVH